MGKLANLFGQESIAAGLSFFDYECSLAKHTLAPWLDRHVDLEGFRIGDFGCHQGGVLHYLREQYRIGSGIGFDLNKEAILGSPFPNVDHRFYLKQQDILKLSPEDYTFDLILFRDSLEHIPSYFEALYSARKCLAPGGYIFISFPPYYSPFGGHQQYSSNWLKLLPYAHYLPPRLFFSLISCVDNPYMSAEDSLADLHGIRLTKLTLGKVEKAMRRLNLKVVAQDFFLLRPAFKVRYGLPTLKANWLGKIPVAREIFTMGVYYLCRHEA